MHYPLISSPYDFLSKIIKHFFDKKVIHHISNTGFCGRVHQAPGTPVTAPVETIGRWRPKIFTIKTKTKPKAKAKAKPREKVAVQAEK